MISQFFRALFSGLFIDERFFFLLVKDFAEFVLSISDQQKKYEKG
jgi:hypothetical protein